MCGRISQSQDGRIYMEALKFFDRPAAEDSEYDPGRARWNVAPGTQVRVIALADGRPIMRREMWGHAGHGPRPYVNARVETASTSGFWKRMWQHGRVLVPADGWYEWTGPKGARVPHFIERRDHEPLLLAAIAAPDGFAIVTAAADEGLLDVHDRRPVALTADDARAWLNPDQTDQAREIADRTLQPDAFHWFEVPKAVGNVRNDAPTFVKPADSE
jgi:putative SOS response-associated peptidase YedK